MPLEQPSSGVVGILLAAGRAQRFGRQKLLEILPRSNGQRVAEVSARKLLGLTSRVIAVVGPDPVLQAALASAGCKLCIHPEPWRGMGSSLSHGLAQCADANAWVIALADMPWWHETTGVAVVDALLARAADQGREAALEKRVVAPIYRGIRGHPVGFTRQFKAQLLALNDDAGAGKCVRAAQEEGVFKGIEVDDPGVLQDIDVPADLTGNEP